MRTCVVAVLGFFLFLLPGCGGGGATDSGNGVGSENDVGKVEPLDATTVITDPETGLQLVNDQVLITFNNMASEAAVAQKINAINGEIVGFIKGMNDFQVRIKGNPTLAQLKTLLSQLEADPDVAAASLNGVAQLNRLPDEGSDPQWFAGIGDFDFSGWSEQTPQGRNWGLEAIYAPSAWDENDLMQEVMIGVVDTGFNINHEDLQIPAQNASGAKGRYQADASDPTDSLGHTYKRQNDHGTHVAGVIGAISNNAKGITGLLWKRKMTVYRTDSSLFDIKIATLKCLKNGAKVINYSLGASGNEWVSTVKDKESIAEEQRKKSGHTGLYLCANYLRRMTFL